MLLSGASGLIGSTLVRSLAGKRIHTTQLIRRNGIPAVGKASGQVEWDIRAAQPVGNLRPLEGMDAAIHLSGANIAAHRWTESYKREIVNSRIESTRALLRVFHGLRQPPRILLCASATGIYGNRGDAVLTEASAPGTGFLAETCVAWEAAAEEARSLGMRVVYLRFGVALSTQGGALQKMLPLFRFGFGGRSGSGRQWMNWIALPDLIRAILYLAETQALEGAVNLVASQPVTNEEFTRALGRAVHRPTIFPAPAFALRLAFGEIADDALLASTRAVPERLLESGFTFEYPEIASALRAIV